MNRAFEKLFEGLIGLAHLAYAVYAVDEGGLSPREARESLAAVIARDSELHELSAELEQRLERCYARAKEIGRELAAERRFTYP